MFKHQAAIRTLLLLNGQVLYVETQADGLLDQSLSECDRKYLTRLVNSELKRIARSLLNLENYSEGKLQSNIEYLRHKVSNLTLLVQVLAA